MWRPLALAPTTTTAGVPAGMPRLPSPRYLEMNARRIGSTVPADRKNHPELKTIPEQDRGRSLPRPFDGQDAGDLARPVHLCSVLSQGAGTLGPGSGAGAESQFRRSSRRAEAPRVTATAANRPMVRYGMFQAPSGSTSTPFRTPPSPPPIIVAARKDEKASARWALPIRGSSSAGPSPLIATARAHRTA